ncbi:AI-2E family transporter [soil metagenome]
MFAKLWANPYLRLLFILTAVVALYLFARATREVWVSFLVAYLLAYLLNPFVDAVAKRVHRAIGVVAIVAGLVAVGGLLWLLGIQIAAQFSTFTLKLPGIVATFQDLPYLVARRVDPRFGELFQQLYINLQRLSLYVTTRLVPRLTAGGSGSPADTLLALAGGGAQVGIIFVLTLYLLYNFPVYTRSFLRAFPHRHRPLVEDLVTTAGTSVGSYVRGQVLIALCVGVMTFLGLSVAGVPLALALGVLAGIFNLIPFLGPILTAVPTLLLAMTQGSGHVVAAVVVLVAVNQIDGHLLTPLVFSKLIALDPVTVIVTILIGAALFGFVGALLAVPVAAFLKVIYASYYIDSAWYKRASDI